VGKIALRDFAHADRHCGLCPARGHGAQVRAFAHPTRYSNLRMHMRWFTRLTNAFSNKIENHAPNVALPA